MIDEALKAISILILGAFVIGSIALIFKLLEVA